MGRGKVDMFGGTGLGVPILDFVMYNKELGFKVGPRLCELAPHGRREP